MAAGGAGHQHAASGEESMERIACDASGDALYDEHIEEIIAFCPAAHELPGPFFFPPSEEEAGDDDHDHGVESIACDASGDALYDEHVQELEDFCGPVTADPPAASCPYSCAQPLEVLYRHYKNCPNKTRHPIYEAVGARGALCRGTCTTLCSQPLGVLRYHYEECSLRSRHAIYLWHEDANSTGQFLGCMPPPLEEAATSFEDYAVRIAIALCALAAYCVVLGVLFWRKQPGQPDADGQMPSSPKASLSRSFLWALATMVLFSIEDYAMAHSHTTEGADYFLPVAFLTMGLVTVGLMVPLLCLPSCCCGATFGSFQAKVGAAWTAVSPVAALRGSGSIASLALLCTYSAGFALLGAQECTTTAFSLAFSASGPLHAIMSTEVVIVCAFSRFYFDERVTVLQFLCFGAMVVGAVIIALSESSEEGATNDNLPLALVWSFIALGFYAMWTITVRVSTKAGVKPLAQFLIMWLELGGYGLVRLVILLADSGTAGVPTSAEFWLYATLAMGVVEFIAVFCMVQALSVAVSTGLCVAVWSAHAAGVAVLVMLFDGARPGRLQIIGMCIVVVGIMLCHAHKAVEGAVAKMAGRGQGAASQKDAAELEVSGAGRIEVSV